jgi:hypothetical protein
MICSFSVVVPVWTSDTLCLTLGIDDETRARIRPRLEPIEYSRDNQTQEDAMRTFTLIPMLVALILAAIAAAQAPDIAVRDTLEAKAEAGLAQIEEMLKVITLPGRAEEAREAGVPEEDVRVILEESAERGLPPAETEVILQETTTAVRENGPVDNFGAFVQARLAEGLRGRDLAAAIHEEHRLRGKGMGHGKERAKGKERIKEEQPETIEAPDVDRDEPDENEGSREDEDRGERKKTEKGAGK